MQTTTERLPVIHPTKEIFVRGWIYGVLHTLLGMLLYFVWSGGITKEMVVGGLVLLLVVFLLWIMLVAMLGVREPCPKCDRRTP